MTYGDDALHWAYSAGDDTLDNFQVLWTQTFDGKDPVWPDWAYAMTAPSLARDFELTFSITGHAEFAVRRTAPMATDRLPPATSRTWFPPPSPR